MPVRASPYAHQQSAFEQEQRARCAQAAQQGRVRADHRILHRVADKQHEHQVHHGKLGDLLFAEQPQRQKDENIYGG
jgi:hypothetical protein